MASNSFRSIIHPGTHPRPVTEGVPFLGFVSYPDRRRLKRQKGLHFWQNLRALVQQYQRGEIRLEQVTVSVQGWVNHTRYGNTVGLRKSILGTAFSAFQPPVEQKEC